MGEHRGEDMIDFQTTFTQILKVLSKLSIRSSILSNADHMSNVEQMLAPLPAKPKKAYPIRCGRTLPLNAHLAPDRELELDHALLQRPCMRSDQLEKRRRGCLP